MFSRRRLAETFALVLLAVLLIMSVLPANTGSNRSELSLLTEPDGTGVWHRLVDRFNEGHPAVPVRLVEGPAATDTRQDMYSTAFLAGSGGYDIVYCDVIWVPKFAAAGWLLDLSNQWNSGERDEFLTADIEAGIYKGRLYRIPAFADAGVLYYRTDLVPSPPASFEDLYRLALLTQREGRWGFVWQGKQYEGLVANFLEVLWGFGGDWITDDGRVLVDGPEGIAALRFLVKTIGSISPPGVTTYMEEDTRSIFQSGRAVFMRNWFYAAAAMDQSKSAVRGHVGFVPMVHDLGSSAATLGGWGFAISSRTPHPAAAVDFVKFMTAPEQMTVLLKTSGYIPARKNLVPPEFRTVLEHARFRPRIPGYAQASDILQRWVSAALSGSISPENALSHAAKETRVLLGTQ
jgi:multiple sugar transport system substrate-binding protein